jgi:hypothetical protein
MPGKKRIICWLAIVVLVPSMISNQGIELYFRQNRDVLFEQML